MKLIMICGRLAGLAVLLGFTAGVQAQANYPARQITFIYPIAAGAPNAEAFRYLAEETGKILGQPMLTDFRGGAGTSLGLRAVVNAPPDGYLIAAALDANFTVLPQISKSFKAEVNKNYAPIIMPTESFPTMSGHPSLPFRDLKGLIAHAKANPGKLTFGSPGVGGVSHLIWERIMDVTGIELIHVPYKGSAAAMPDRLSGRIHLYISGADFGAQIDSGQLFGIAVVASRRSAALPQIPTLDEAGLPGLALRSYVGIVAPPGTPRDIVMKLNGAFEKALGLPEVQKRMDAGGWGILRGTTPEQLAERIKVDTDAWAPILKRIKLETD